MTDAIFMQRALALAGRGLGRTWPNPMVGAVVVRNGRVVGEGWHRYCGGPHAEVYALRQAGKLARGATLYVTLEPCAHYGKTPPCAPAVVASGIRRVVVAMRDPNPKVSGLGLTCLRQAGVEVVVGLMQAEARALNKVFIKRITTGMPYVICKAAVSMDGKIACTSGASRWITGLAARRHAHRLRALADAIVIGAGTAREDNPALNVRLARPYPGRQPLRVILEGKKPLPGTLKVFDGQQATMVMTARKGKHPLEGRPGVRVLKCGFPGHALETLLTELGKQGASLVLVEGGGETHASFLGLQAGNGRIWADEVQWIYAPVVLGGRRAPGPVGGKGADRPLTGLRLKSVRWEELGGDWLMTARPVPGPERK